MSNKYIVAKKDSIRGGGVSLSYNSVIHCRSIVAIEKSVLLCQRKTWAQALKGDRTHSKRLLGRAVLTVVGECFQQAVQTAVHAVRGAVFGRQLQLLQSVT